MKTEHEWAEELLAAGRRLYAKDLATSTDGSMSVKLDDGTVLCTASGTCKGLMTEESLCLIDQNGRLLRAAAGYKPTAAVKTHLLIYKTRPDVRCVIHAYPRTAVTYAMAGQSLTMPAPLEALNALGCVPCLPDGLPKTPEAEASLCEWFAHFDAVLFSNISAMTYAKDPFTACNRMEAVEMYAQMTLTMQSVNGGQFAPGQVDDYMARRAAKHAEKHPAHLCVRELAGEVGCHTCSGCAAPAPTTSAADPVAELVARVMKELNR